MMRQRAGVLFFAALLFASFIGGAVRVFLSPDRIKDWALKEISTRQTRLLLDFERANLSLNRGVWPELAIVLNHVQVKAKDPCLSPIQLDVDELSLPLRVRPLIFSSRIELGELKAKNLIIQGLFSNLSSVNCPQKELAGPLKIEEFIQQRLQKELENTYEYFSSLRIDKIIFIFENVSSQEDLSKVTELRDIQLKIKSNKKSAALSFYYANALYDLNIQSDQITLKGRHRIKEGRLLFLASLSMNQFEIKTHFTLTEVPLKELIVLLSERGFNFRTDVIQKLQGYSNQWLNCKIDGQGLLKNWEHTLFTVSDCKMLSGTATLVGSDLPIFQKDLRSLKIESP